MRGDSIWCTAVIVALASAVLAHAAPSDRTVDALLAVIPIPAASVGFAYRYDPESGAFVRESDVAGQIYMERPVMLGKGRWNVNLSYQWVRFRKLEPVEGPSIDLKFDLHEVTPGITYGVTDDLDVNVTFPVFSFGGPPDVEPLFVRAKYRLLDAHDVQLAAGFVFRMFTRRLTEESATGRFQMAPYLYASTVPVRLPLDMHLQPYANLGVNFDADGIDQTEGRWAVGLDWRVIDRLTASVAVLARHRVSEAIVIVPVGRTDIYDFSAGVRVRLWRETLAAFANALVPLNREGLRTDPVPLAGVEATF